MTVEETLYLEQLNRLSRVTFNGEVALNVIKEEATKVGLPLSYVLAIGSRETNLRNIIGDLGHGRGMWQVDDRSHQDFLGQHPSISHDFRAYTAFAFRLMRTNIEWAKKEFPQFNSLKIAASAYNAGQGGAHAGVEGGNSDLRTTGKNYGADVMHRMDIFDRLLIK